MAKVIKISENSLPINFNFPSSDFQTYWKAFKQSELGALHDAIPWDKLVKALGIKNKKKGRTSFFSPRGKLALMFLKSYTGLSDRMLLDNLAANYQYQFFCDLHILPGEKLPNYKIISEIRVELSKKLDINNLQKILADNWKSYIEDQNSILQDATCYESSVRYPTDVKLLWEANEWIYKQIKIINKQLKGRMPRSKYKEQKIKHLSYSKKRKKSYKETQKRKKSLLYLLEKLLNQLSEILLKAASENVPLKLSYKFAERVETINKIFQQQKSLYEGTKVTGRIISISKPYLRPIVRGKEVKRVEFGAKANLIQIDKINFLEHIDFEAFNESTHFQSAIQLGQELFKIKIRIAGADAIYATNKNRKFCSTNNILNNFVRKGKASKEEKNLSQMRKEVNKERATVMEGAFGTQKNHYNLSRINARTKLTELLWIFFGIHTANAVEIGKRMQNAQYKKKVA